MIKEFDPDQLTKRELSYRTISGNRAINLFFPEQSGAGNEGRLCGQLPSIYRGDGWLA
jgi:hypothetical protein